MFGYHVITTFNQLRRCRLQMLEFKGLFINKPDGISFLLCLWTSKIMLREVCKGLVVLLSSAVAIPYAVAAICNVMYAGPHSRKKLKRAFHPRKVLYLNYRVLKKFLKVRHLPLLVRWKWFYTWADSYRLIKDIPFGRNDRSLDLYFPMNTSSRSLKPVVVFVYGGSWSAGDKSMYGLLCSQVADRLQAIVCCPNYSLYPQGYVDDMIQDVVDCVAWIYENIHEHGGNKDKMLLMGHSAGAHLAVMAVLELLHDEWVHGIRIEPPDTMEVDEQYFDGSNDDDEEENNKAPSSAGSSSSFDVLNGNGNGDQKEAGASLDTSSTSFILLNNEEQEEGDSSLVELQRGESQTSDIEVLDSVTPTDSEGSRNGVDINRDEGSEGSRGRVDNTDEDCEDDDDMSNKDEEDSVITVRPRDIDRQPTLMDLGKCIKGVVGLAGVYDIGEHYEYERCWGVEDVSSMSRAMYGDEHFDRFSPSLIVKNLTRSVQLPAIVLAHGSNDQIVPLSSSSSFAEALSDIFADVTLRLIPECSHTDICLDMMDIGRKHYDTVMNIILETGQKIF